MTDPLTPPDADLRGFPYFPLDVVRLRDSRLAATATGEEFRAAVLLWCAAWHQIPAASLPQDDRELALLAGLGRDLKGWRKVAKEALRGWKLAEDGRLYHHVLAEKAIEALERQTETQAKTSHERDRKRRERDERATLFAALREAGQVPAWNSTTSELRTLAANLSHGQPPPVTRTGGTSHRDVSVTKDGPDTARNRREREGKGEEEAAPTSPPPSSPAPGGGRRVFQAIDPDEIRRAGSMAQKSNEIEPLLRAYRCNAAPDRLSEWLREADELTAFEVGAILYLAYCRKQPIREPSGFRAMRNALSGNLEPAKAALRALLAPHQAQEATP